MNLSQRQKREPEPVRNSWNCYSPLSPHSELFLAQKIVHSDTKVNQTTRDYQKVRSDIVTTNRSKVSLRHNKEKKLANLSGEVKSNLSGNVKKYNSSIYTQEFKAVPPSQRTDSFFTNLLAPNSSRRDYDHQSPSITISSPQYNISTLPPPPVITFSHLTKETQPKWIEIGQKPEKNEEKKNEILKTETTVGNSQSEQLNHSGGEKDKFQTEKNDFIVKGLHSLDLKKDKQVLQNPEPDRPHKSKQGITKSLVNSHNFNFKKEDKLLGQSVLSYYSEKNLSKKRVQRMSEVEEIKSQPDSDENNESDAESIVLGRLDLSASSNLDPNKTLHLPIPSHPTNSSIQFRDSPRN